MACNVSPTLKPVIRPLFFVIYELTKRLSEFKMLEQKNWHIYILNDVFVFSWQKA